MEAPPGTVRIAALGDSTTYGFLLPENKSYGRILETRLNALCGDAVYQVINAGVPSYDLSHIKYRYINKVAPYKPDIVLLMSGPNDREYLEGDRFEKLLDEILVEARKSNSRIALLSYPFLSQSETNKMHVERLKRFAEKENIRYIDLFQPLSKREECFFVDTHPKACGQAIMAEIVLEELIKDSFIPGCNNAEAN
jgi:lysophospholipase L1-like esterase